MSTPERERVYAQLAAKGGFERVGESGNDSQMRLIGRVREGSMPNWLVLIQRLLLRAEQAEWNVDISKQYFLRGEKVLYCWRLIFQADGLHEHLSDISNTIHNSPGAKTEVTEVPLHHSKGRNRLVRGKGAQPADKSLVGPMAMNSMRQGG